MSRRALTRRANAGQVGRQDADKRHKCSVFDNLNVKSRANVASQTKQWPKFARAQTVWKRAVAVLFSDEVRNELFKKFGVRKRALTRDFRIQNDHNGFGIGVHPDNHKKILTFQFYIPTKKNPVETVYTYGTCLHTKEQHQRRDKGTGYSVCAKKMAYLPNTAYAFPVTRGSYHSVERAKSQGARLTFMLNWYSHVMDGAAPVRNSLLGKIFGR